mgnify:CR=1 FL=1
MSGVCAAIWTHVACWVVCAAEVAVLQSNALYKQRVACVTVLHRTGRTRTQAPHPSSKQYRSSSLHMHSVMQLPTTPSPVALGAPVSQGAWTMASASTVYAVVTLDGVALHATSQATRTNMTAGTSARLIR